MKTIVMLVLVLFTGLECFARGEPFAKEYKENGYTVPEGAAYLKNYFAKVAAYQALLQQIANTDGWISFVDDQKVSPEFTLEIIGNLVPSTAIWNSGEVSVGSIGANGNVLYFNRPSYSDRVNRIAGLEPVGILDVTTTFGWLDSKGKPFPKRVVMALRCLNTILDTRTIGGVSPVAPIVKKDSLKISDTIRHTTYMYYTYRVVSEESVKYQQPQRSYSYYCGGSYFEAYRPVYTFCPPPIPSKYCGKPIQPTCFHTPKPGGSGRDPGSGGSGRDPGSGGSGRDPGSGGSGRDPGSGGSGRDPGNKKSSMPWRQGAPKYKRTDANFADSKRSQFSSQSQASRSQLKQQPSERSKQQSGQINSDQQQQNHSTSRKLYASIPLKNVQRSGLQNNGQIHSGKRQNNSGSSRTYSAPTRNSNMPSGNSGRNYSSPSRSMSSSSGGRGSTSGGTRR